MKREIDFDLFVRGLIGVIIFGLIVGVINWLSSVLLPFVVAWVLAYLLYPIVGFFQYRCRLRNRTLSVLLTLLLVIGVIVTLICMAMPSINSEWQHLKEIAVSYMEGRRQATGLTAEVQHFLVQHAERWRIEQFLHNDEVIESIKATLPKVWSMLWSTAGVIINIVSSLFALIYMFLLLIDYEIYSEGWVNMIPVRHRSFASQLMTDIEHNMSSYFRGQALVALSNCIMFSAGFWIIGLPLPFLMGVGIGLISFIPYIQLVGFIPAFLLALLKSADTGESFWVLMGCVVLVYGIIQVIQDTLVTPRIMQHIMGLPSAIVLLALTVWGYMLGILGLIIALPATTLFVSYYRRYILNRNSKE